MSSSANVPDLCAQCAEEEGLGCNNKDLAYLITKAQATEGLYAKAYCELCGLIIVNHKGECMSKCCTKRHGDY